MSIFELHNEDTAPAASREFLTKAKSGMGFVPNLYAVMATSPAVLETYITQGNIFAKSGLSPVEQQVVLLSVSRANGCEYCVSAHSVIANMTGMTDDVLDAIRNSEPIPDNRLNALSDVAVKIVEKRGWLDETDIKEFLSAGFNPEQLLDVIAGVSMKTLSNYVNHIAETPLDEAFTDRKWAANA